MGPLPPLSARERSRGNMQDMSIADLEEAVRGNPRRRPAAQTARGPQQALEVNRWLIEEKKQQKAMQRKSSREEFDRLLERNRATMEAEKSQAVTRHRTQKELSQLYKSKIGEKEEARANAYNEKLAGAPSSQHWPYSEGESIDRERSEMGRALREEMQGFMEKQRQAKPPRSEFDPLVAHHPAKAGYSVPYPVSPREGLPSAAAAPASAAAPQWDPAEDSHVKEHPRFLQRAGKPPGRSVQREAYAARTLEEKVAQTKRELEATHSRLVAEHLETQDGLLVNDALKYDRDRAKAAELRRNAQYLRSQMVEQKEKSLKEVAETRAECVGYWGPEEKPLLGSNVAKDHCTDLIKQMEVDQQRRTVEKGANVREEKKILHNAMQEMVKDRIRDQRRAQEEKSVLTQTWGNQQKITDAKRKLAIQ